MRVLRLIVWILAVTFFTADSFACSLAPGYLQPSNYDLVRATEAIVVAQAVSYGISPEAKSEYGAQFRFRVLVILKGRLEKTELAIGGIDSYYGKSSDNDFRSARPGAFTGACNAYDYKVGGIFVLFLRKSDSGWVVSGPPFTRINEEVDSVNSPWVAVIQHYVRIGAIGNYEVEKGELRKLQETAKKNTGNAVYPSGLSEDIESYFQRPYPTRSYGDLIALYNSYGTIPCRQAGRWHRSEPRPGWWHRGPPD